VIEVVVRNRRFGVSTHLYRAQRLSREHLLEIAAHGFEAIELASTQTHLDYHNPAAVADLQQWLAEAGLELNSVHAPVAEGFAAGRTIGPLSLASADPGARALAVAEAEHALHIARRIPTRLFVAHLGLVRPAASGETGDTRSAARRSVEELLRAAEPLGVRIAVEVIPNELSRVGSLVHFVEHDLDGSAVGVCLDTGHAHLAGDLVEAIETVSEHLVALDVHDNRKRTDDHLLPFEGSIDWAASLTAVQKIGYEGTIMMEVGAHGTTRETLVRARDARKKLEKLLAG